MVTRKQKAVKLPEIKHKQPAERWESKDYRCLTLSLTSFPFKVGEPCLIELDLQRKQLSVRQINREKAVDMGWRMERKRSVH